MTGHHSLRVPMPPHESILSDGMHRKDDRPMARWPIVAVVLLGIGAVIAGIFATSGAGQVEDQLTSTAEQAQKLGQDVTAACAQGIVVQDQQGRDLCKLASEVQSDPVPGTPAPGIPGVQGLPGDRGPGPTPEQIETAVVSYCAARGECAGRPPSTEEVAAAVAQYLTANPPQPGRPPTPGEIADAVAVYFANNPPPEGRPGRDGVDGKDGATGERGPGPTEEEIEAAVAEYLAANPPPACQAGTHVETVQFADGQFGLACVFDDQPDPDPDPTDEPEPTSAVPTTESDPEGLFGG